MNDIYHPDNLKINFYIRFNGKIYRSMIRKGSFILLTALLWPVIALAQSRLDSLEGLLDFADKAKRVEIFCDMSELYWQRSFDTSLVMATHAENSAGN